MSTIASLNLLLTAQTAPSFGKSFKTAETTARGFASRIGGIGSLIGSGLSAAMGPLGLLVGGIALIKTSFDAAAESQISVKKLESVLAATGGTVGFTSNQLQEMAANLQRVTNFEDDATIAAMAIGATFKNIKGDQFQQLVESAADLSTIKGMDLSASVTQLGKALNDPVAGLTKLTRLGITFNAQQQNQIKTMAEAGDMAGAQGIMLEYLQSTMGGAAVGAADPFKQFKNSFGDMLEQIGGIVRSGLGIVLTVAQPIVNGLTSMFNTIAGPIGAIMEVVSNRISTGIQSVIAFVQPIWNGFVSFLSTALASVLDYLAPIIVSWGSTIRAEFNAALGMGQALWSGLTTVFTGIANGIGVALNYVGINMESTANFGRTMVEYLQAGLLVLEFAFTHWKDLASLALVSTLYGIVSFANQTVYFFTVYIPGMLDWFSNHWREVFMDAWSLVKMISVNIFTNLKSLWDGIVSLFSGGGFAFTWTPLTEGFKSAISELPKIAAREIGPLETSLSNEMASLANKVSEDFGAFTANRSAELGQETADFRAKLEGGLSAFLPAEKTAAATIAPTPGEQLNSGPGEQAKVGALTRGSVEAFKAVHGGSGIEKLTKVAQQQLDEQKKQTSALEDMADAEVEEVDF